MPGEQPQLEDLLDTDPELHRGLTALLATPVAEQGLGDLMFTIEMRGADGIETAELICGGADIAVRPSTTRRHARWLLCEFVGAGVMICGRRVRR